MAPPGPYINPALSPDGTRIAVTRGDPPAGTSDIWIIDSNRAMRQFTSPTAVENFPTWSPDGRRVLFMSDRGGRQGLYQKDANAGAGDADELLLSNGHNVMPFDWSRDGRFVLYSEFSGRGLLGARFWILPTLANSEPAQIRTDTPIKEEGQGQISPDGRWFAYVSDVNGSPQVFVRPFPHGEGRWLISPTGGFEPKWRGDGRELYYFASDQMLMSVQVTPGPTFTAGEAHPLFRTNLMGTYLGSPYPNGRVRNEFAVTPDGQRFLINQPIGGSSAYAIRVVVNWPALLGTRPDGVRSGVGNWLEHRTE
jgi:Tol biopolymer transport system component